MLTNEPYSKIHPSIGLVGLLPGKKGQQGTKWYLLIMHENNVAYAAIIMMKNCDSYNPKTDRYRFCIAVRSVVIIQTKYRTPLSHFTFHHFSIEDTRIFFFSKNEFFFEIFEHTNQVEFRICLLSH